MKGFKRNDLQFSLCGLNCALCPMKLGEYCPGCGGGEGNQGCTIARCSLQYENIEYCFQCIHYPCEKYDGIEKYDSFVTHRHQLLYMQRIQEIGIEQYHYELKEKLEMLMYLLKDYNDGRKKNLFSVAINLLNNNDIRLVIEELKNRTQSNDLTLKEKSALATKLFQSIADKRNITLKLNKKQSTRRTLMNFECIYNLSEEQIHNLMELFHEESWSKNRDLDDVKKMLETSWIIAIRDHKTDKLIAFSRVLTDYVYRAFIYDVIVAKDYRGLGFGKLIVDSIVNHEDLKNVERIELYCVDSNIAFYKKIGFDKVPDGTNLMRYNRKNI